MRIILEQQVSLAAAKTMTRRLSAALDGITAPAVVRAGEDGLRRLGLTRQKASYCVGVARQVLGGRLSLTALGDLDDATARERLTSVKGIGPWSADVYLLMALRRPDVWPAGDLALLNSAHRVLLCRGTLDQDRLSRIARRWRPYRAVAARILWHDYLRRMHRSRPGPLAGDQ